MKPATGQIDRLGERPLRLPENGSLPRPPFVLRPRMFRSLRCPSRSCRLDRPAPLRMFRIILSGFRHGATGTRAASVKKLTIATDEGRTTLPPGDPGSGTFVKNDEGCPVLRGARRHASPLGRAALRQRANRKTLPSMFPCARNGKDPFHLQVTADDAKSLPGMFPCAKCKGMGKDPVRPIFGRTGTGGEFPIRPSFVDKAEPGSGSNRSI